MSVVRSCSVHMGRIKLYIQKINILGFNKPSADARCMWDEQIFVPSYKWSLGSCGLNEVVYKKSTYSTICLKGILFTCWGDHWWKLGLGLVYEVFGFVSGEEVIGWNIEVSMLNVEIQKICEFYLFLIWDICLDWFWVNVN